MDVGNVDMFRFFNIQHHPQDQDCQPAWWQRWQRQRRVEEEGSRRCPATEDLCPCPQSLSITRTFVVLNLISPTLLVTFLPVNVSAPRLVKKLISKNVWVSFEPSDVGFDEGLDWITNKICKERYILEAKSYSCTNNLYQTLLLSPSTRWQTLACGWCTVAQSCYWSPNIVHQQRIFCYVPKYSNQTWLK